MSQRAMEGTCWGTLVRMAMPLCQQAQRRCPRAGPGRPPEFDHWRMAVLIMVAILKKKKGKSAQYRFLSKHRGELKRLLRLKRWPARSTYFDRYRQAHRLFDVAMALQGQEAIAEGVGNAQTVAGHPLLLRYNHRRGRENGQVQWVLDTL